MGKAIGELHLLFVKIGKAIGKYFLSVVARMGKAIGELHLVCENR